MDAYINAIGHKTRRADALVLLPLMNRLTGEAPRMWGDSIVGFGAYNYKQRNGTPGRWFLTGFAPRKSAMTIHIMPGCRKYQDLLSDLGTFKTAVSCLYVTRLSNVDMRVLEELILRSVEDMREMYR